MTEYTTDFINYRPTTTPSLSGEGHTYYDADYESLMVYDTIRNKWLSETVHKIELGRTGALAAGTSFRKLPDIPTSTSPILVERAMCLVGISATTSVAEQFVIRVDDVSGGSGSQATINYQAPGPAATLVFFQDDLDVSYDADDQLDVYVLSSSTGNISNPHITLNFRWER